MSKRILITLAVLFAWLGIAHAQDQGKPEIFPQLAHTNHVSSVAYSPDGKLLASGSYDHTVKLWDVASGREIRSLSGHTNAVTSIAFSPNGKVLASGSADQSITLSDVASGRLLQTLTGHFSVVSSLAFSHDGKWLASGSWDETVKLWDLAGGSAVHTFSGHTGDVNCVAFSPDGTLLASGGADFSVKLWDVASGRVLQSLRGNATVNSVGFSPDGKRLAAGRADGTIDLWDVAKARELHSFIGHSAAVYAVAFSPDGKELASGGLDRTIKLWDATRGIVLRTFGGQSAWVSSVAFSPDGKTLASGFDDNAIKLWEVASGRELRALSGRTDPIIAVGCSRDGKLLVSGSIDTINLWDGTSGHLLRVLHGNAFRISSVALSPDGKILAAGGFDGTVKLWDAASGRELMILTGHEAAVSSVAFSPDGTVLASASSDKSVKLWDVASGRELHTLSGHSDGVLSVAFSPDGKLLASGSWDRTIKLWDVASGTMVRSTSGPAANAIFVANSLVFSPDGTLLASSGGFDRAIEIWDVASLHGLHRLLGHVDTVTSVAFAPDGTVLASGSADHTIKLWDAASGRELQSLSGHTDQVTSVAFSPDGKLLISGSWDGTARLWNESNGEQRVALVAFNDGSFLSITPEGFFDSSSAQAEENLNVRVGNRVFGISSYRENFYRPDLVKLGLAGGLLTSFGNLAEIAPKKLPPVVELVDLPLSTDKPKITVDVRIADGGDGIGPIRVFLNGTAVAGDDCTAPKLLRAGTVMRSCTVALLNGPNELRAVASNSDWSVESNAATAIITANLPPAPHGVLHAVVVGIQEFPKDPANNLTYSVADAQLIAETLKDYAAPLFEKTDIRLLTTAGQTDKDHVIQALRAMKSAVGPNDEFVFYVASHGIVQDNEYYLITSNVGSIEPARLKADAIGRQELTGLLADIPATKKLVIVDTCHAGGLIQDTGAQNDLTKLGRNVGLTVLAATSTDQEAMEGYDDHGLFTYVVVKGLTGRDGYVVNAAVAKDGTVDTSELVFYVQKEVPPLALNRYKHSQDPTAEIEPNNADFQITKVK